MNTVYNRLITSSLNIQSIRWENPELPRIIWLTRARYYNRASPRRFCIQFLHNKATPSSVRSSTQFAITIPFGRCAFDRHRFHASAILHIPFRMSASLSIDGIPLPIVHLTRSSSAPIALSATARDYTGFYSDFVGIRIRYRIFPY
jgi:hypothetical protein